MTRFRSTNEIMLYIGWHDRFSCRINLLSTSCERHFRIAHEGLDEYTDK